MGNNGENKFKKAYNTVKHLAVPNDNDKFSELVEAADYLDKILSEVVETLDWMIPNFKWKHRQQLGLEDEEMYPDSQINWSPELTKAIELLEKLR